MREAALGWVLVAPIKEFLERRGLKVESPGFLRGKSGTNHMFDLAASGSKEGQKVTVIDLAASTGDVVSEKVVIAMFAKVYDVAPDKACLVAIPKMSKVGNKMAELYNIEIIEAKNQKEAIEALKVAIKS